MCSCLHELYLISFLCKSKFYVLKIIMLTKVSHAVTELDQLLEDAPSPFIMQHAAKISGVRKRVSSLNSLLKSIQHRVDNIDRMLSVGVLHGTYYLPRLHVVFCLIS